MKCIEGEWQAPTWPTECVAKELCGVPPVPHETMRLLPFDTNPNQYRVGEHAYYYCEHADNVLDDDSGMNVYENLCDTGAVWVANSTTFPVCYEEPKCSPLPTPSEASKLVQKTVGDNVKIGESVVYECKDRALYHETPNVSSLMNE